MIAMIYERFFLAIVAIIWKLALSFGFFATIIYNIIIPSRNPPPEEIRLHYLGQY